MREELGFSHVPRSVSRKGIDVGVTATDSDGNGLSHRREETTG